VRRGRGESETAKESERVSEGHSLTGDRRGE